MLWSRTRIKRGLCFQAGLWHQAFQSGAPSECQVAESTITSMYLCPQADFKMAHKVHAYLLKVNSNDGKGNKRGWYWLPEGVLALKALLASSEQDVCMQCSFVCPYFYFYVFKCCFSLLICSVLIISVSAISLEQNVLYSSITTLIFYQNVI